VIYDINIADSEFSIFGGACLSSPSSLRKVVNMPKVFVGSVDNWFSQDSSLIRELAEVVARASSVGTFTSVDSVKIHTDELVWPDYNNRSLDIVVLELPRDVPAERVASSIAKNMADIFSKSKLHPFTVKVAVGYENFGLATAIS
jgi:hypothetical protein